MYKDQLALYDRLVATQPEINRKGKTMPYTSANGYMFSQLNKAGEIGIRLPKETAKRFMQEFESGEFRSYGAVMRDYVLIPESLLKNDLELVSQYLLDGYHYALSLEPK